MKRILVVGGSGLYGRPVVHSLNNIGISPLILTHNPARALKRLTGENHFVQADVTKPDSLRGMFQNIDSIHINLNTLLAEKIYNVVSVGVKNVVDEAKRCNVKLITFTSQANVDITTCDFPLVNARLDAEKHIKNSGIDYIIFRPVHFMESLNFFIRGNQITDVKDFSNSLYWMSCVEYASVVAQQLLSPTLVNKTVYLKGPEKFTLGQALLKFKEEVRQNSRFNPMTFNMLRSISTFSNNSEMIFVASYLEFMNSSNDIVGYDIQKHVLIEGKTTLQEWLVSQKKLINQK